MKTIKYSIYKYTLKGVNNKNEIKTISAITGDKNIKSVIKSDYDNHKKDNTYKTLWIENEKIDRVLELSIDELEELYTSHTSTDVE